MIKIKKKKKKKKKKKNPCCQVKIQQNLAIQVKKLIGHIKNINENYIKSWCWVHFFTPNVI